MGPSSAKFFLRSFAMILLGSLLSAFQIQRSSSDRLILQEPSCEKAELTLVDFSNWKKNSDGDKGCDPKALRYEPNSRSCTVDATDCLPEHVQKYQGMNPEQAGPNCFNTALVMAKILPNHRYTSEYEFSYFMRPPLCRALKNNEERKPGDIGAIRGNKDGQKEEVHAFIYINEKIAYTKNSYHDLFPYQMQSIEGLTQEFRNGKETSYFRCQSMDEYLNQSKNTPDELRKLFHKVGSSELCFESHVMTNSVLTEEAKKNLIETGEALVHYLKEQTQKLPKPAANSEEQFMIGALQVRLFSLAKQLENLEENSVESQQLHSLVRAISLAR